MSDVNFRLAGPQPLTLVTDVNGRLQSGSIEPRVSLLASPRDCVSLTGTSAEIMGFIRDDGYQRVTDAEIRKCEKITTTNSTAAGLDGSCHIDGGILPQFCFLRVAAFLVICIPSLAFGQETVLQSIHVEHKEGASQGRAVASLKGPVKVKGHPVIQEFTKKLNKDTVQAWSVAGGTGAILLVRDKETYRVRYYSADADKGRWLGTVSFHHATLIETQSSSDLWAFALLGDDKSVVAGDTNGIRARLTNAPTARFSADALEVTVAGGDRSIKLSDLLGARFAGHIYRTQQSTENTSLVQFFPDGHVTRSTQAGDTKEGAWITDGHNLVVSESGAAPISIPIRDLVPVIGVPAKSRLVVRLTSSLSSRTAKKGMPIEAVLISPGIFDGKILLPQGSTFKGTVEDAHGVGLAIKHESAAITLHFTEVDFPDGRSQTIDARVAAVENSRETVTATGKIQGIRSTGTIGHSAENQISSLAQADPIAYIFTSSAGPAVLGFAEPEILYNSGTELQILFEKPLLTEKVYTAATPHFDLASPRGQELERLVQGLPFRTETLQFAVPSDLTNLVFIGQPEALLRAFQASGWTTSDALTATATFQTMKTLTGNEVYTQAPMSVLVLNHQRPIYTLQKTTNTFSSRHHLRIFQTGETFDGQPVLTASSTQDIGIAFSYKQKTFIHVIDQYLDNERAKVLNDLEFTGCLRYAGLVPRPAIPTDAYNSTGDRLRTDGAAGVAELKDCSQPRAVPVSTAIRAGGPERAERNTLLSIKDTLYRGNLVYTGVSGGIKAHHFLATKDELGADPENWRHTDATGTAYRSSRPRSGKAEEREKRFEMGQVLSPESQSEIEAANRALVLAHKWDPPRFELGLNVGYSYHRNTLMETTVLTLESTDKSKPLYLLGLGDATYDGWAAGISLTLNSWKWFSNEFSYMREQTKFDLVADTISSDPQAEPEVDTRIVGLVTRRFAYNFVANARPRTSRWRPYIMAGPAFQLVSLSDAPLKKPSGYFRLGLSNIGLFKAAFDFGRTPALDGGGIFQPALQYGAGMKFRIKPRLLVRGDYVETWSPNPHIINKSYDGYLPNDFDDSYTTTVTNYAPHTHFFQQHATVGFAFTF